MFVLTVASCTKMLVLLITSIFIKNSVLGSPIISESLESNPKLPNLSPLIENYKSTFIVFFWHEKSSILSQNNVNFKTPVARYTHQNKIKNLYAGHRKSRAPYVWIVVPSENQTKFSDDYITVSDASPYSTEIILLLYGKWIKEQITFGMFRTFYIHLSVYRIHFTGSPDLMPQYGQFDNMLSGNVHGRKIKCEHYTIWKCLRAVKSEIRYYIEKNSTKVLYNSMKYSNNGLSRNLKKCLRRFQMKSMKVHTDWNIYLNVIYELFRKDLPTLNHLWKTREPGIDYTLELLKPYFYDNIRLQKIQRDWSIVMVDMESYNFITCHKTYYRPFYYSYTKKFRWTLWLTIFAAICVIFSLISFIIMHSDKSTFFSKVWAVFFTIIAPLFYTSSGESTKRWISKKQIFFTILINRILTLWALLAIIVNITYQIVVISDVIQPVEVTSPWNNIDDLDIEIEIHTPLLKYDSDKLIDIQQWQAVRYHQNLSVKYIRNLIRGRKNLGSIWEGSLLYNSTFDNILTWVHSAFGFFLRENAISCRYIYNKWDYKVIPPLKLFCEKKAEILKRLQPVAFMNISSALEELSECNNTAYVDSSSQIEYVNRFLRNKWKNRKSYVVGQHDENYMESVNWSIVRASEFEDLFLKRFKCLVQSGIYGYLKYLLSLLHISNLKFEKEHKNDSAGLDTNFVYIFHIYLMGCFLASVVYLLEWIFLKVILKA